MPRPVSVTTYGAQVREHAHFPEELGGDTETGPSSLRMMEELQTLESLFDARRSGMQNERVFFAILSNFASRSNALHMVWPKKQHVVRNESSFFEYLGPLPKMCPSKHRRQTMKDIAERGTFHSGLSVTFGCTCWHVFFSRGSTRPTPSRFGLPPYRHQ